VALRPRVSPGVPLSRDGTAELPAGTRTVKEIGDLRLLVRSVLELQVRSPHMGPLSLCVEPDVAGQRLGAHRLLVSHLARTPVERQTVHFRDGQARQPGS
jgi:hypothetical protein